MNQHLSPAEAALLATENHPIAKYTVEQNVSAGTAPTQNLTYLDNQVSTFT